MFKLRLGIKVKITLTFSAIFILLSFTFNIYSYRRIKQVMINDNDRYLLSRASSLLAKTEINPVIIPLPDKNAAIRIFFYSGGVKHVVFQSPGIISKIVTPAKTGVTDTLGMRVAYVSYSDDNPAELVLAVSSYQLDKNLSFLFTLLFISTVVSVIIAGIGSYMLASFLLLPVQRIIDAAKTINTNKLRDRIPVKNTNDELQELTETINDMLKRIDDSLQQQQNFFASASHELKTPLAILRAELEVQLKRKDLTNDITSVLKSQLEEINRLQDVVQEFLIISQLKSGGLNIHLEEIDLSALILKSFNQLNPLFQQKQLKPVIKFDEETQDFFVRADSDKIRIIMINLLENVFKYASESSAVQCVVKKQNGQLQLTLINKINTQSIQTDKLSEAFYRGDILQQGAGLGLWLCNQMVIAHRGNMVITSRNAQFIVSISLPII